MFNIGDIVEILEDGCMLDEGMKGKVMFVDNDDTCKVSPIVKDEVKVDISEWFGFSELKKINQRKGLTAAEVMNIIKPGERYIYVPQEDGVEPAIISLFGTDWGVRIETNITKPIYEEPGFGFNNKWLYKLEQPRHSFDEAFKAYEEGKTIESVASKFKFFIDQNTLDNICIDEDGEEEVVDDDEPLFSYEEIKGEWYVLGGND